MFLEKQLKRGLFDGSRFELMKLLLCGNRRHRQFLLKPGRPGDLSLAYELCSRGVRSYPSFSILRWGRSVTVTLSIPCWKHVPWALSSLWKIVESDLFKCGRMGIQLIRHLHIPKAIVIIMRIIFKPVTCFTGVFISKCCHLFSNLKTL